MTGMRSQTSQYRRAVFRILDRQIYRIAQSSLNAHQLSRIVEVAGKLVRKVAGMSYIPNSIESR